MGNEGFDLLRIRPVRALILWCGFPYVFQVTLLIVFAALAVIGWGWFTPAGVPDKLYAKTNLTTLVIWGLWWPAMIWVAVLLGRAWCAVCPLELVGNLGERLSRRLGLPRRPLPPWAAAGWIILALYTLIQFLVAGAHIHRVPAYTSLYMIGLLLAAVAVPLVFRDRAFCRGFCPVGLLLGTLGRGGMLAVRAAPGGDCDRRAGEAGDERSTSHARACPSLLNPPKLRSNKDCLVCGRCIKASETGDMRLMLRRPFPRADLREPLASWPVTLFVMLLSGFVISELCSEWDKAKEVFLWVPSWTSRQLGITRRAGYVEGAWTLVLVPLLTWCVFALIVRMLGARWTVGQTWRRLALPMAVVAGAGQMAKGLAKFVSWAGFLPRALKSPDGIETVQDIHRHMIAQPGSLLTKPAVSMVAVVLLAVSLYFAIREARLARPDAHRREWLPIGLLTAGFVLIVAGWSLSAS